jgi:two-component system sensor histidine kinase AlgZ
MRISDDTGSPLDTLWQPPALVWAILVVLGLALVLALAPGAPAPGLSALIERFGLVAFIGAWVVLLALAGLYVLRRTLARYDPITVAWIGLAMLMLATWLVGATIFYVARELLDDGSWWSLLLRATLIALIVGSISLGAFHTLWRNMQLRAVARRSEAAALQARVDPHFLFNTLNTAVSLLRERPDLAETLLYDLSDLFRAALSTARMVPLPQELNLCQRYLEIERLRLGERLNVRWNVPDPLPEPLVPILMIQPLVENAVRHGIEPHAFGGELEVVVECTDDLLTVRVSNPLPPSSARVPGHHVGQSSVRSRIDAATERRGRLTTNIVEGRYVAQIVFPFVAGSTPAQ